MGGRLGIGENGQNATRNTKRRWGVGVFLRREKIAGVSPLSPRNVKRQNIFILWLTRGKKWVYNDNDPKGRVVKYEQKSNRVYPCIDQ